MVKYDRTSYLKKKSHDSLREASQNARDVVVCEIGDCTGEPTRLSSTKCADHRGICGFEGCGAVSWGTERSYPRTRYPNGKDFRYCELHKGRLRNKRTLGAPRGKAFKTISHEEDPVNPDCIGTWGIDANGYVTRSSQTFKGRSVLQFEHRLVMEEHIGRMLEAHENIHHRNGWVADNRLDNLELWDKPQTPGQRVADKIEWCKFYLGERGMEVIEHGVFVGADSVVGWKSAHHRMLVASELGRALYKHELVSHIDRDLRNNNLENLELWTYASPSSYEEDVIVAWMIDEFLPQYGYKVERGA